MSSESVESATINQKQSITSNNIIDNKYSHLNKFSSIVIKLKDNYSIKTLEYEEKHVMNKFSVSLQKLYVADTSNTEYQHFCKLLLISLSKLYQNVDIMICNKKAKIFDNGFEYYNQLKFEINYSNDKIFIVPVFTFNEEYFEEIVQKNLKEYTENE